MAWLLALYCAITAAVALIFARLARTYRRLALRLLALAWLVLAATAAVAWGGRTWGAGAALVRASDGLFGVLMLGAALHAGGLLACTRALEPRVHPGWRPWTVPPLVVAGAAAVAAALAGAEAGRLAAMLALLVSAAAASALFAAGVYRTPSWPRGIGRGWTVAGSVLRVLVTGAGAVGLVAARSPTGGLAGATAVLAADALAQVFIGLGVVASLLDEARGRVRIALAAAERSALHDASTNLPNRRLFTQRIEAALADAARTGRQRPALVHLDLDRFKMVNEAWSQAVGDAVLRAVGDRLRTLLQDGDVVARLGGDSFALLLLGREDEEQALAVANRVARRLAQPFDLHDREIELTASIGVAAYPEHGTDAETLLRSADAATNRAKDAGGNRVLLYHRDMSVGARERLDLEHALRRAIGGDELRLLYQPIVEMDTGRIVRFEALLRWQHPERGLLPPDDFLPLATQIGLADALDQWVLRTACADALRWRTARQGSAPRVAVNLTAKSLQHPHLVARIETVLADTGLPTHALELEITESAAMDDAEHALGVLRDLKRLGLHVAIDDFGTGYSSLSYLRTFPIDTIKIDRAFVRDLGVQPNATALIHGIVALARNLGLVVVAEGIETEVQREILREAGCDLLQGFGIGYPVPVERCLEMLARADADQSR